MERERAVRRLHEGPSSPLPATRTAEVRGHPMSGEPRHVLPGAWCRVHATYEDHVIEESEGLREAAGEMVAWTVVEVRPGQYQCRVCGADVTRPTAPHEDDCESDALYRALTRSSEARTEELRTATAGENLPGRELSSD